MVENSLIAQKHTSGEVPKVCSVCTIACSQPTLLAARSLAPVAELAASRHASQYERLPQANQAGRCYS